MPTEYQRVRDHTERLASALSPEDQTAQSMPDASPIKWHRAHTSWFFETFVLRQLLGRARCSPSAYSVLFNSYYEGVGPQFPRAERGLITRPSCDEVAAYRRAVDEEMTDVDPAHPLVVLGLHHEQQHQELMHTDFLHLLSRSPLAPSAGWAARPVVGRADLTWSAHPGGIVEVGHPGLGFAFDNEGPRHRALLSPFELADRLVNNAEYIGFIEDGGYDNPLLWTSMGWAAVQAGGWRGPAYWERGAQGDSQLTLEGRRPIDPLAPVCHLSWFEAEAFARWAGARLPTELEWEVVMPEAPVVALGADLPHSEHDAYGRVWQWTASPYVGYPGYAPADGAVGEYNGKFMCNQFVLRGSSVATSVGHARRTYRNFFPPHARWQFTGLRLARNAT